MARPDPAAARRSAAGKVAAYRRWAFEPDRTAATEPGRRAFMAKFEAAVDPDGTLDPAERARRAESLRKAHFARLAAKSARARAARKEGLAS